MSVEERFNEYAYFIYLFVCSQTNNALQHVRCQDSLVLLSILSEIKFYAEIVKNIVAVVIEIDQRP